MLYYLEHPLGHHLKKTHQNCFALSRHPSSYSKRKHITSQSLVACSRLSDSQARVSKKKNKKKQQGVETRAPSYLRAWKSGVLDPLSWISPFCFRNNYMQKFCHGNVQRHGREMLCQACWPSLSFDTYAQACHVWTFID